MLLKRGQNVVSDKPNSDTLPETSSDCCMHSAATRSTVVEINTRARLSTSFVDHTNTPGNGHSPRDISPSDISPTLACDGIR